MMANNEKRCKICHVVADIDKNGRCPSCADIYNATQKGMHYGDYIALKHEHETFDVLKHDIPSDGMRRCRNCNRLFPRLRNTVFCGDECQREYALRHKREYMRLNRYSADKHDE